MGKKAKITRNMARKAVERLMQKKIKEALRKIRKLKIEEPASSGKT